MWFEKEIADTGGIHLVDIGCRGALAPKWAPIERLLNVTGFDPSEEECRRLEGIDLPYRSARFLPVGVADRCGTMKLHKTAGSSCHSFLEPDRPWLSRFTCSHLFDDAGTADMDVVTLDSLDALSGVDVDVIKVDSQGLELPILRHAERILDQVFLAETETGYVKNYLGETTFSELDGFMQEKGFAMFDLISHRMPRRNEFGIARPHTGQLLWCEVVWLKDYKRDEQAVRKLTHRKAIRALALCEFADTPDFALELAECFESNGVMTATEVDALRKVPGGGKKVK